jgi:lipid-A-disaccharide synthase-like uncharacterized protein
MVSGGCDGGWPAVMQARVAKLSAPPQRSTRPMDFLSTHLTNILHALQQFELTPWKMVGFAGTLLFTSRWFVQLYYTRKYKRVVMPLSFWWLSVFGSVLLLAYFTVGKNDSVGILSNFFPVFVSVYNLIVHLRHRKNAITGDVTA